MKKDVSRLDEALAEVNIEALKEKYGSTIVYQVGHLMMKQTLKEAIDTFSNELVKAVNVIKGAVRRAGLLEYAEILVEEWVEVTGWDEKKVKEYLNALQITPEQAYRYYTVTGKLPSNEVQEAILKGMTVPNVIALETRTVQKQNRDEHKGA